MSFWNNDDEDTEEEVVANVAASAFTSITDSIIDTHSAVKVLAITVTAELGAFLMLFFAKDKALDSLNDSDANVWIWVSIAAFVVGFLIAFASYRMVADKWRHRHSGIYIWLVSIAAGIGNILLFFGILTLEIR